MSRPDPIEYAERLYSAIRAANFSPISFLAFGNAVKDGVAMRNMPRIAAEPFMRIVGEMLVMGEESAEDIVDSAAVEAGSADASNIQESTPSQRSSQQAHGLTSLQEAIDVALPETTT